LKFLEKRTMIEKQFHYNGVNKVPRDVVDVVIQSNLTVIGKRVFANCHFLTAIITPPAAITIGDPAFSDYTSCTAIILPPTTIKEGAFERFKPSPPLHYHSL